MPRIKSAKKALRQNIKRRAVNDEKKEVLKKLVKKISKLAVEKKKEEAKKLLPQVYKMIDKATKKNLMKKNTASRQKAKIAKMVNTI